MIYKFVDVSYGSDCIDSYMLLKEQVEGIIENYCIDYDKSGNVRYDEFQVNGVEFTVGGFAPVGYSTTKAMGSQLDNDIGVKIHYIPYKYTNIITHQEISEE